MIEITYRFVSCKINRGTKEQPQWEEVYTEKKILCTRENLQANEEIAKLEAYNGEYTLEEIAEEYVELTQMDKIEAQLTYTAMMTDTLLEVEL